ncbi:hypothetical protein [Sphingomonas sp. GM_Shp_2]|uniref:hypothetical protein n=1 Tax=Sphingomonas sp. GM_Shp_2 TaxID=2937380 RepID=UPI00226A408B|nr:hypothetical protein [Sphingomonas sp. GM_Shp_2]
MAKVNIHVKAKAKGTGLVTVHIDGSFVGLDAHGEEIQKVSKPPADHWYCVTLSGQPGDTADYELTDNGEFKKSGKLEIGDTEVMASTYKVMFRC